jgi:predicted NAD/FAD-dependent oxidoreductase
MKRRSFLAGAALPLAGSLVGCERLEEIQGGFTGISHERGHLLRERKAWPAPTKVHKTRVLIAGGGVAALAAARALRLKGMDDFTLLELEDQAGGNSRGGAVNGIACPLGAHYLPVPGDAAVDVQNLLEELGLRQRLAGRWVYDERHLCHSPQERLFFNGEWQDGLLPLHGVGRDTLAQYQRFAALVARARQSASWSIPVSHTSPSPFMESLVAVNFASYLAQNGLNDPHLRWYLDYCCHDDYGAGIATVSAWAGLHYFASRHGFNAPRLEGAHAAEQTADREGVLTWPEGNGWLTRQLALPLKERLQTGRVVVRIAAGKQGVEVDAFNTATQTVERWQAERCIVALPMFVSARVVENPPEFLRQAAAHTHYAPWLVANIHIKAHLHDRPGAPPSWDNVIYDGVAQNAHGASLGYVDAMHQSLQSVPGATVLTHYRALGDVPQGRNLLMDKPWVEWRDVILADLARAHPDIATKATRIDITRYGHAMAVPVPGGSLNSRLAASGRLSFAHSDWAGYSVFEEAFTLGHGAGAA